MKKEYTILLCDDDKFIEKLYKTKLDLDGFTVLLAGDGRHGIDLINTEKPDLVLLDLMMPEMSGFEVLERIRSEGREDILSIPIIVTSNLAQKKDIEEAKQLGAVDFIVKSRTTPEEMSTLVKKHLPK